MVVNISPHHYCINIKYDRLSVFLPL